MMTPYKYYSPVTDVTFRKVFGENLDLAASLLNAFLPLPEGRKITNIHYVSPELMPETPARKNSLVDVCCEDSDGTTFLVEMQLNWDTDFMQRVVFNTSKAYVKQLNKGKPFQLLQPVYSLNFVQGDLHKGLNEWYHPYQLVHIYHTNRVFDGLKIVFAELEKYEKFAEKGNTKMDLWMRYFTEMTEKTRKPAPELLADPDIAKAIECLEVINYDDVERELYDRYWDAVSVEATWKEIGKREKKVGFEMGREEGIQQGIQQGIQKGIQQGEANTKRQLAINMLAEGLDPKIIAKVSGMTDSEIRALVSR
jgi:predicted transposase/invertase (TIGR01784 family)